MLQWYFLKRTLQLGVSDRPHHRRAPIVQSYSPGSANVNISYNTYSCWGPHKPTPNGILISSAVFAGLTSVIHTHAHTERKICCSRDGPLPEQPLGYNKRTTSDFILGIGQFIRLMMLTVLFVCSRLWQAVRSPSLSSPNDDASY